LPGHSDARARLAQPVGNALFFAGEAVSPHFFSTAHGAWETGLRVRGVRPLPVVLAPVAATTTIGYDDRSRRRLSAGRAVRLFMSRSGKEVRRFANGLAEGFLR
jgi:hypothetical protein